MSSKFPENYKVYSHSFDGLKDLFKLEIQYLEYKDIMSITKNIEKAEFQILKRQRFMSEDNCHPSYQVLNYHNLILQDEYMSNDSKVNINQTSRNFYQVKNSSMINEDPFEYSGLGVNTKNRSCKYECYKINQRITHSSCQLKEKEKQNSSRKSTEMKSAALSKPKDSHGDFDESFELQIEESAHDQIDLNAFQSACDELYIAKNSTVVFDENDNLQSEKNSPNSNSNKNKDFNFNELLEKKDKLKSLLNPTD